MEATSIIMAALALLILLGVTSIQFVLESRKKFSTDGRDQASWGHQ